MRIHFDGGWFETETAAQFLAPTCPHRGGCSCVLPVGTPRECLWQTRLGASVLQYWRHAEEDGHMRFVVVTGAEALAWLREHLPLEADRLTKDAHPGEV